MRRRRSDDTRISFFSFQDIITCLAGIMIFIALLMVLDVTTTAFTPPSIVKDMMPEEAVLHAIREVQRQLVLLEVRKQELTRRSRALALLDPDQLHRRIEELLHGDNRWLANVAAVVPTEAAVAGGISSEEEEAELESLNDWVESEGLPRGTLGYDLADAQTGEQKAVFDLAWPNGMQEELSQPVAVLLNEDTAVLTLASQAGYRCFTDPKSFRRYVKAEVLAGGNHA